MEMKIYQNDRLRVSTDMGKNFIDVSGITWEFGMSIDLYPNFHYIEIREKEGNLRVFCLDRKSVKKELDFGWWDDAEVIYSLNRVSHDL